MTGAAGLLARLEAGEAVSFEAISAGLTPFVPLLARLPDTRQDAQWHAEGSVAAHSALVVRWAHELADGAGLRGERRAALILAAALHDVGKALTTRDVPDEDGVVRVRSPQHARRGRDALSFRLLDTGFPARLVRTVLALVAAHHSLHRALDGNLDRGVPALARRAPLPLLTLLARADARGRVVRGADARVGEDTADLLELAARELGVWDAPEPLTEFREQLRALLPGAEDDLLALALGRGVADWEAGVIHTPHEAAQRVQAAAQQGFARLTVLCGPSGSGKSTLAAQLSGARVISLDALRGQLGRSAQDQRVNGQVMQAAREALREGLRRREHVVWDATSLRRDQRAQVLGLGHDYGALTRLWVAWTPPGVAASRNAARARVVPGAVLADQLRMLEFPDLGEAHEVTLHAPGGDLWTLDSPFLLS
ncbi:AAA family ATPase [Deinococcus sedimenti]|uniref:HDIG domain-containing protein n=1 Tax=Deinococcus sedimenti TaxID=1867090 RepID=A0ABQ2S9J3_9DEIO|nr:AAA family ATPase [Deinococcus sedimenti]GGS05287.1 HDIG domain-containing protein [Deinococcus sedimenti]